MPERNNLTFTGRVRSFRYAFRGLKLMIVSQHNAWIHALATVLVIAVSFYFHLTRAEWCWIIFAIISVWTAEALNTAFEFLTDVAAPEFHPLAEKAKDVAAGAVLITAMGSALIGVVVFGSYFMSALHSWK